mgnify:FL=1
MRGTISNHTYDIHFIMGWAFLRTLFNHGRGRITMHKITKQLVHVFRANGYEGTTLFDITMNDLSLMLTLRLPVHKELSDLEDLLPNIQQELNANDYRILQKKGKKLIVEFGTNNIDDVSYNESYICSDTLKIKLPSPFGYSYLDFADGASCHLLNGGTTRMGKTVFLLYTATMLYIQTKGEIELHITSTKLKDYYPFDGVENVSLSRTPLELNNTLDDLILEYQKRDRWLYSERLKDATDAKSVKELYPDLYYLFKPVFLIIDEYARFADNNEIKTKVMELVESAGYVNIHIIISTQRPDARTVLHPRIKANLLARICFTTADKNNSLIILDREGAENLGKIKGRALFLDSDCTMIQVPYMETTECEQLLLPYKKENEEDENNDDEITTGSTDNELSEKIQGLFSESLGEIDICEQLEPGQRDQSCHETPVNGWFRLADPANKG